MSTVIKASEAHAFVLMREAYEKHLREHRHVRPVKLEYIGSEYEWEEIQSGWLLWQAAWLGGQRAIDK